MILLSIDYDEFDAPASYRAVTAHKSLNGLRYHEQRFATGDPVADWVAAIEWVAANIDPRNPFVASSSTVDNFCFDSKCAYGFEERDGTDYLIRS